MNAFSLSSRIESAINRILRKNRSLLINKDLVDRIKKVFDALDSMFIMLPEIPLYHSDERSLDLAISKLNSSGEVVLYFISESDKKQSIEISYDDITYRKVNFVFVGDDITIYAKYFEFNDYLKIENISPEAKYPNFGGLVLKTNFVRRSSNSTFSEYITRIIDSYNKYAKVAFRYYRRSKNLRYFLEYIKYLFRFIEKEKENPHRILKFEYLSSQSREGKIYYRVRLEPTHSIFLDIKEGLWLKFVNNDRESIFKVVDVEDLDEGICILELIRGEGLPVRFGEFYVLPNEFVADQLRLAVSALLVTPFDEHLDLLKVIRDPRKSVKLGRLPELEFIFNGYKDENDVNKISKLAIKRALSDSKLTIIYGPPGSGKTQIIAEIIIQLTYNQNKKVLFVAPTHIAVDNVLQRIKECYGSEVLAKIAPIRIGPEERVNPEGAKFLLPAVLDTLRSEVKENLKRLLDKYTFSKDLKKVLDVYHKVLDSREQFSSLGRLLVRSTKLLCTTLIGAVSLRELRDVEPIFDVLILDEASKASFIDFLVPAIKAKKWIIIGDPYQLPPYLDEYEVRSILKIVFEECHERVGYDDLDEIIKYWRNMYEARIAEDTDYAEKQKAKLEEFLMRWKCKKKILNVLKAIGESILISPITYFNEKIKDMAIKLEYQFRMHPDIAEISNKLIYKGTYKSAPNMENKRTLDIQFEGKYIKPVTFLDTATRRAKYEERKGTSYINKLEAEIIFDLLKEIIPQLESRKKENNNAWSIGIITFYAAQARYIRDMLRRKKNMLSLEPKGSWIFQTKTGTVEIKVSIVDRFQGQEKDIIVLSFVRSNRDRDIGFLRNRNRINVAITRARYKLIMIGDSRTLNRNRLLREIISYAKKEGTWISWFYRGIKRKHR